ncbi:hypothetical protein SEA_WHEELBITE_20 [Arthrobacter phage Wheelbite]|uniref:Uncharacterized protein n=1 Tax=Arthrobacter phage Wheelbite TaxID=2015873 RepID=A0A222ZHA0_9CAUD|nr:hypothetical protein KMD23_gp20 [Arthrobacter phage Wheelbite]ASR84113.1 hypothetical protein SEA_WHEELBITE_20 [Arthrobacter phage Wheelbite]
MAECQKRNDKCVCAKNPDHRGQHQCMCGQTWMGRSASLDPNEHDLMANLKDVVEPEGAKLEEMKAESLRMCALIRGVFGVEHDAAHAAINSFKFSCQMHAERSGKTEAQYMDDLTPEEWALLLGACVGAVMTVGGNVGLVVEERDEDGE